MVTATGNRHGREKQNHILLKQQNQFKMKSKIKILIVSCVIAAAAVTGFNMAQNSNNMDVSLADIAVMARADGEQWDPCPGLPPNTYYCQWNWNVMDCIWSSNCESMCLDGC